MLFLSQNEPVSFLCRIDTRSFGRQIAFLFEVRLPDIWLSQAWLGVQSIEVLLMLVSELTQVVH